MKIWHNILFEKYYKNNAPVRIKGMGTEWAAIAEGALLATFKSLDSLRMYFPHGIYKRLHSSKKRYALEWSTGECMHSHSYNSCFFETSDVDNWEYNLLDSISLLKEYNKIVEELVTPKVDKIRIKLDKNKASKEEIKYYLNSNQIESSIQYMNIYLPVLGSGFNYTIIPIEEYIQKNLSNTNNMYCIYSKW